jgi:FtsH-binding integral membrane protein
MEYIVGFALALFFCAAAAGLGLDRERAFYPAVAIAVASYYLAFAVVDGRNEVMQSEVAIAAVFIFAAVAGFKRSPWFAVIALGGHGVMDAFHNHLVHNTGVPQVWPGFCMAFDVTAAVLVALVMVARARKGREIRVGLSPRHGESP